MFYNELSGYSIKIDKKLENGIDEGYNDLRPYTSEEEQRSLRSDVPFGK